MVKLMVINNKKVILRTQESKIGYSYHNLYIEVNELEHFNLDTYLRCTFSMTNKDFQDWLEDAEVVPEDQYESALLEIGVDYKIFAEELSKL